MLEAQKRWYAESLPLAGEHIVDAGANVGELSEFFFDSLQGRGHLLSVEPLAENVAVIEERIARTQASPRWCVRQCAVSAIDGEVNLLVGSGEGIEHNSIVTRQPAEGSRVRTVPAQTLSTLCPDATVVKLDIEGHEYEVLAQSLPLLKRVRAWAIELHLVPGHSLAQTVRSLVSVGFSVYCAGRQPGDQSGRWISVEMPDGLDWDAVPVAQRRPDGRVFKMLHIIALRR